MITIQNGKKRFFRVDANLLKLGELGFFENAMKSAKEVDAKSMSKMGFPVT
jgi:hypothetical protein